MVLLNSNVRYTPNGASQPVEVLVNGTITDWIYELSGSVAECLTRDRGTAGSSLTSVTALWSFSKTHLS